MGAAAVAADVMAGDGNDGDRMTEEEEEGWRAWRRDGTVPNQSGAGEANAEEAVDSHPRVAEKDDKTGRTLWTRTRRTGRR